MSFFFSLKNKLGLVGLVLLTLSIAISHGYAKSPKEIIPLDTYTLSSQKELLLLKVDNLYYVMMVEKMLPQDNKNTPKSFGNHKKDKENSIPLNISRKEYKEIKDQEEMMKKHMSFSGRDLPE